MSDKCYSEKIYNEICELTNLLVNLLGEIHEEVIDIGTDVRALRENAEEK